MKVVGWTSKKLEAVIKAAGWKYAYAEGGHRFYYHATRPGRLELPYHIRGQIKPKTAASILERAGLR